MTWHVTHETWQVGEGDVLKIGGERISQWIKVVKVFVEQPWLHRVFKKNMKKIIISCFSWIGIRECIGGVDLFCLNTIGLIFSLLLNSLCWSQNLPLSKVYWEWDYLQKCIYYKTCDYIHLSYKFSLFYSQKNNLLTFKDLFMLRNTQHAISKETL